MKCFVTDINDYVSVISSFMICDRIVNMSKMRDGTSGPGTAY